MSTAFSTFTTSAPRVVGIGYGIFQTPENPVEPQVITVPVDYSLYFGAPIPDTDLGSTGDYYFRNTSDSAIIYRKLNNIGWSVVTLITGGAVADLTAIYNDIITINGELTNIESTVTSILSNYATQDFVETKKTEAITISNSFATASFPTEAAVRATADGFLEGKYTLKVTAGNVVTGMNITSSTGGGVDVSSVIFQADKFEIWNGSSAQAVFSLSGSDVTISGWKINPNTLTGGNVTLNSTGVVTAGTGDDVAIMSAANVTYRFWCGAAAPGSAPFSVTKDGDLVATSATVSGTITSSSGTIGGFTLGAGSLTAGTGQTSIAIFNNAGTGITLGDPTGTHLLLRKTSGGGGILFFFNAANQIRAGIGYDLGSTNGFVQVGDAGVQDIVLGGSYGTDKITWTGDTNLYRSAANTLKTDDAFVITGACTAASFSGDGSALTALNATNLGSGTVPDARFPATLPAVSGANLTNLNASNLSSGTIPNARISLSATGTGDVPINGYVSLGGVKLATVA